MKRIIIIFLILSNYGYSQLTVGVKISGLAFHPQQKLNEKCYRWKLDTKGHFVGFVGISFTSAYQFNDYLGVKITQTFLPFDCAGKFASVTHLGLNLTDRIVGWKNDDHRISASFGPLLYLRRGWTQIEGYEPDEEFIHTMKNEKWQRKFVWYGAQAQYDYYYKTNQALSFNFFPGYPYIYTFGIGETLRFE